MRKYAAIAATLILAVAVLFGCGSDKKTTNPQPTAEQQYQALKEMSIDSTVLGMIDVLNLGLGFLTGVDPYQIPGFPKMTSDADTFYFDYSYTNGWHVMNMVIDVDSLRMEFGTQVQFKDGEGTAWPEPDENTTSMQVIFGIDFTADTYEMKGYLNQHFDFTYTNLQSPTITVVGEGSLDADISGHQGTAPYDIDLLYDIDVNNVTVSNPLEGGTGCATGGTMAMTLKGTFSGYDDEGHEVSGSVDATITITFNAGGTATVVVTIGGSQFTETVPGCET